MSLTRRSALAALASLLLPWPAAALQPAEAQRFVAAVADEMIAIVSKASAANPRSEAFLALFRRVAALDDIGRFTMGQHWRTMSPAQQKAFLEAFERYASRAYTNRIGEYNGQTLVVNGAQDMGRRGVLVRSVMKQPGAQDVAIEWLVSDRNGKPQIVDLVAEGVSLAIAQREEFAAMVERRGGDYDRFIRDLAGQG
jgi:phospholipid transport system substrate-binding protein